MPGGGEQIVRITQRCMDCTSIGPRLFFHVWHIYCLPLSLAWCVGAAVSGCLVARLHRDHPATLLLITATMELPIAVRFGWPYARYLFNFQPPVVWKFHIGYLVDTFMAFVGIPLCAVMGGLLASGHARQ